MVDHESPQAVVGYGKLVLAHLPPPQHAAHEKRLKNPRMIGGRTYHAILRALLYAMKKKLFQRVRSKSTEAIYNLIIDRRENFLLLLKKYIALLKRKLHGAMYTLLCHIFFKTLSEHPFFFCNFSFIFLRMPPQRMLIFTLQRSNLFVCLRFNRLMDIL